MGVSFAYNVENVTNKSKMGRMPALIVIDKEGKIRYEDYRASMSDIPSNKNILSLLEDLNREYF